MEQAYERRVPFGLVLLDCHMPEMDGFDLAEEIRQSPHLSHATIMMLTSGGQSNDITRCRDLGIAAYVIKPIKQSDLLDSILTALKIDATRRVELPRESAVLIRRTRRLQILLAEDNEINQKLAIHHLEKQGHFVMTVPDGHEAVEALARERFDLVLMDVQMPKMGGFEATAKIRNREHANGPHIPIVAMTARAMKGDRESCLAAGMDGYVSKPIQTDQLFDEIERVVAISFEARSQTKSAPLEQRPLAASFDLAAALNQVSNDKDLFKEIVGMFISSHPQQMLMIKSAIESEDVEALSFAAHSLKGVVGNFRADAATKAAQRIESMADRNDLLGIDSALADLQVEIDGLSRALTPFQ